MPVRQCLYKSIGLAQGEARRGEAAREKLGRMGAEALASLLLPKKEGHQTRPLVVGLQPSALLDHVARVDWDAFDSIPGDRGGSQQVQKCDFIAFEMGFWLIKVQIAELEYILSKVTTHILPLPEDVASIRTIAGGSVANTVRGLSAGFGISCAILGACGDDEQGKLFVSNMSSNCVNLSMLRMKQGPTGQCACLVDALGNRTMRPCLSRAVRIQADELTREDLRGSKWLVLRYGFFNLDLIHTAIRIAKQEGVLVSMDLASFEMVRDYKAHLLHLLENGMVDLCFANEDEARELMRCKAQTDAEAAVNYAEAALNFLAANCQWAVVTLGPKGCIAKHGKEVVQVGAVGETQATDATGAGDLFASGFLYGMVKGLSLEECCKAGVCSGGSVIRALGGEVRPENWRWMYQQMQLQGLSVPDLIKN